MTEIAMKAVCFIGSVDVRRGNDGAIFQRITVEMTLQASPNNLKKVVIIKRALAT